MIRSSSIGSDLYIIKAIKPGNLVWVRVQFWIQECYIVHRLIDANTDHRFLSLLMSVFHLLFVLLLELSSLEWLLSHCLAHNLVNNFIHCLLDPTWYWFISNLFFAHLKLSTDYQSMRALVHLFTILTVWIPYLNWVIPLIHFYLKLPSTFSLQPQRVSWSDNKLAPLPGRGYWSSASLGDDKIQLWW